MKCEWIEESDGYEGYGNYNTGCKHMFCINDGTPADNEMKYCCFCGKELAQTPFVYEEDQDNENTNT